MANDLSLSTWVLDTASATPVSTDWLWIESITWDAELATAGDNCIVKDVAGAIVFIDTAVSANYNASKQVKKWVRGIAVPTLVSGKVYVELG